MRAMVEVERAAIDLLAGRSSEALSGSPAAIGLAGYTSGMGPLLGSWVEQGLLETGDRAAGEVLRHQLRANSARMDRLLPCGQAAVSKLAEAGVATVVLKGAHTASRYFPNAGCRPMADIDLLISPADAPAGAHALCASGYRQTTAAPLESTWVHCATSPEPLTVTSLEAEDPWSLDLHVSLDVRGPPGAAPARLSRATAATEPCVSLHGSRQLCQPMLLLHLAAHTGSGFHNMTLLRLVEIVLVARADAASGALRWDEFCELGQATGAMAFAFPALAMARRLSTAAIPQEIVERSARAAPARVRRVVDQLRPASAHRIDRPTLGEHFAWTAGLGGWLRRLGADVLPEPKSLRGSARIHVSRARGLWRLGVTPPRP
jgi:hypothetical protein